ncbi:MAG: hypothetical protein HY370_09535 [Proteobacteria bacterium]|nr:hypothetical protein [Pseudomonadota bacterium]
MEQSLPVNGFSLARIINRVFPFKGGVTVPLSEVYEALGLDSGRYEAAEAGDNALLLDCLNMNGLYHEMLAGPVRAVYADPDKKIPLWLKNPPPDDSGTSFPPDAQMSTSPAILVCEYRLPFGHHALFSVVRGDILKLKEYRQTAVFGLYGTTDGKDFKFRKLLVPKIDSYRCLNGLQEAEVTDLIVIKQALSYLTSCKERVFNGESLFARDIWKKTLENKTCAPAATDFLLT